LIKGALFVVSVYITAEIHTVPYNCRFACMQCSQMQSTSKMSIVNLHGMAESRSVFYCVSSVEKLANNSAFQVVSSKTVRIRCWVTETIR